MVPRHVSFFFGQTKNDASLWPFFWGGATITYQTRPKFLAQDIKAQNKN